MFRSPSIASPALAAFVTIAHGFFSPLEAGQVFPTNLSWLQMRKDEAYWKLVDWRPTIRRLCMARVAPTLLRQAQAAGGRERTPGIERPMGNSGRHGAGEREGSERKSMAASIDLGLLKKSLQSRYPILSASGFSTEVTRPKPLMAPFARVPR